MDRTTTSEIRELFAASVPNDAFAIQWHADRDAFVGNKISVRTAQFGPRLDPKRLNLVECPGCGNTVSWRAPSCPHCGTNVQADHVELHEEAEAQKRSVAATKKIRVGAVMALVGGNATVGLLANNLTGMPSHAILGVLGGALASLLTLLVSALTLMMGESLVLQGLEQR